MPETHRLCAPRHMRTTQNWCPKLQELYRIVGLWKEFELAQKITSRAYIEGSLVESLNTRRVELNGCLSRWNAIRGHPSASTPPRTIMDANADDPYGRPGYRFFAIRRHSTGMACRPFPSPAVSRRAAYRLAFKSAARWGAKQLSCSSPMPTSKQQNGTNAARRRPRALSRGLVAQASTACAFWSLQAITPTG